MSRHLTIETASRENHLLCSRPAMLMHSIRLCLSLGILLAVAATGVADDGPVIPGIAERMQEFVDANEISGAVNLVATREGIVHFSTTGLMDIESGREMEEDAIFWIASMTKPITGTAIMMLHEEGLLSIDEPVSKYIPEFADLTLEDGTPVTITITHLLTHSSGLADISADQSRDITTLADAIPLYVSQPVRFEPGSRWSYCQSSINTAGRIVEIVSGMTFDRFLDERLFGPLGMTDTTFYLSEEQVSRLATPYRRTEAGELEPTTVSILWGKDPTSTDRFPLANGGLFSTAHDYYRFCSMILNGGELDGTRILRPETVELMTSNHSGDLETGFTPGNCWGIGWCVVREPQGITAMLSSGTCGHGGAYGTQAWIDREAGRIYILMVQRANFQNGDNSDVRRAFQEIADAALDE